MSNQLISVITVCFNAEKTIRSTMESVLNQTYPSLEYLIIDGGSSDHTKLIVEEMKPRFEKKGVRFVFISEPDNGIYHAMNKGLALSHGTWVNFMNSGDSFFDDKVIEDIFKASIDSEEKVIYGNTVLHLDFGDVVMFPKQIEYMQKKMAFCHQSVFVYGDLMREWKFNQEYRLAADYDFFYRYYQKGYKFRYIDRIVSRFESEEGASSRNRLLVNREYAHIHGVDETLKWKLWFFTKTIRIKIKDFIQFVLPHSLVKNIRKRNYRRIVNKRLMRAG